MVEVGYFAYTDSEFVPRGMDYLVYEVFADPDDIGLFIANMLKVFSPFRPVTSYEDDSGTATLVYALSDDSFSGVLCDEVAADLDARHLLSDVGDVMFKVRFVVMIVEGSDAITVAVDHLVYPCGRVSYGGEGYTVDYVRGRLSINELYGLLAIVAELSEKYPMKIK